MKNRAVFLDRDGTLIEEVGYAVRPEQIRIQRGVARALARLAEAGYKLVVVTNQSGIARGLLTEEDLNVFHQKLDEQLELLGARVDVYYSCPHLPDPSQCARPELAIECDCRKPKPGLLLQAARDMEIDLRSSWMVGDTWRDIQAGQAAGTRTIKVPADREHDAPRPIDIPPSTAEVADLEEAADVILDAEDIAPEPSPPPPLLPEEKPAPPEPQLAPEHTGGANSGQRPAVVAPVPPEKNTSEPPARADRAAEADRAQPPVGTCARCSGPVTAEQVLAGEAARRDGMLLCPACIGHLPTGGDRTVESATGLLQELLAEVRRIGRARHGGAMTFLRMVAYVLQVGVLFCALGMGIFSGDRVFYIQVAILLQLMVVALLLFERTS
jgi:D-glycero-D-manno-heptose 1,7-bisphosphate phosphatase